MTTWLRWFAWYPVHVHAEPVWFKFVNRHRVELVHNKLVPAWKWEYKP